MSYHPHPPTPSPIKGEGGKEATYYSGFVGANPLWLPLYMPVCGSTEVYFLYLYETTLPLPVWEQGSFLNFALLQYLIKPLHKMY